MVIVILGAAHVPLLGVLLVDPREVVDGVVDNVFGVQGVLKVGRDLLHGHPVGTPVQKDIRFVGEGEEEEDGGKEHLDSDHEVVVGRRLQGVREVDKGYPMKNCQQEACKKFPLPLINLSLHIIKTFQPLPEHNQNLSTSIRASSLLRPHTVSI